MKIWRDIIISVILGTVIALLTCCTVNKRETSAEELKNEYLKKEQEEKAIRLKKERIRRGELTYAEAIKAMYEKHGYEDHFSDEFRFCNDGHYYKGFYTVENRNYIKALNSTCGIVHDPNCPCFKDKSK